MFHLSKLVSRISEPSKVLPCFLAIKTQVLRAAGSTFHHNFPSTFPWNFSTQPTSYDFPKKKIPFREKEIPTHL